MVITFLFPNSGSQLSGGLKVICEYANRLSEDGHDVHIAYAGSLFWGQKTPFYKCTGIIRFLQTYLKGYSCNRWFALDKRVKEHWCWSLNERHVPKSDIYMCTSPYTAMYLKDYQSQSKKFYFIQDYENWGGITDEKLKATYHYPLQKIVISNWLKSVVVEENESCVMIPNGFNTSDFRMMVPFEHKNKYLVTMLYHRMGRKDCAMGFRALDIVRNKYPQLRVNIFGTPERPANLPAWYEYRQQPDKETLNRLYDEAAIYIGTSRVEGWGLTVGEAMLCGCAVACTDIPGYREMARDYNENENENQNGDKRKLKLKRKANVDENENFGTALLSPVGDAEAMAANIIRLIEDDELRCRIAKNGHEFIQQFTWDRSYRMMKETILGN